MSYKMALYNVDDLLTASSRAVAAGVDAVSLSDHSTNLKVRHNLIFVNLYLHIIHTSSSNNATSACKEGNVSYLTIKPYRICSYINE